MSEKYTIGFAGFGYMGTRLLKGFLDCRSVVSGPIEVVGFRRRPHLMEEIERRYPSIVKVDRYEKMFEGRRLSDIVIASPTELHIHQAKFAIERGTDIFLEKPISTDLEETRTFVEFALDHDAMVFIDYIEEGLPISKLRDAVLFGELSGVYGLVPTSFIAVRTKDREDPEVEKNWRDFDNIAGRDSIHCLVKILKTLVRTIGRGDERNMLPRSVQAKSKDLIHPDPAFSKKVSGEVLGEMTFDQGIVAKIYTSALAEDRRGFAVPSCFGVPESEQEEVKLQHITCANRREEATVLILDFINNTFDLAGADTAPIDQYLRSHRLSPQKREVEIEGTKLQRYCFGETEIETHVMDYYFGLKELKKQRRAQDLNQDISLCTLTAGYYTQLCAELLQQSADLGGEIRFPQYSRHGHLCVLQEDQSP